MAPRVLMFGWEFPPHNSGGLGTACFGLTEALAKEDVDITFILPKKLGACCDFMSIKEAGITGVDLIALNSGLSPYRTSSLDDEPSLYRHSLVDEVRAYGEKAREIARNTNFDVIHAHDWLAFAAGIEAKKVSGKPLVAHVHATEYDRGGGQGVNPDVFNIEYQGLHMADKVVTVSERTKNMVVQYYGVAPDKVEVVYNGVKFDPITTTLPEVTRLKSLGHKIVLFVGRITLQKGPDYFVRAAKRVLEFEPNTYFIIAGAGDMERKVIEEVASAGISDKVIFAGFARGEELEALYRLADIYVLPSVSEPFGITPLESLVCGTPVLVSKQSGVAEVLNHALKVDFWDVDNMADQIVAVLRHSSLKEVLSKLGQEEAGKQSWRQAAKACLNIYKELTTPAKI